MRFMVEFKLDNYRYGDDNYVVDKFCECNGLTDLELVRNKLNDPTITPDMIEHSCYYHQHDVCLELTEIEAINCGVFKETCHIKVNVPVSSLNKYLYRDIRPRYDVKCKLFGYIKHKTLLDVRLIFDINKDRLLIDWVNMGCPFRWDPMSETGEFPEPIDGDENISIDGEKLKMIERCGKNSDDDIDDDE